MKKEVNLCKLNIYYGFDYSMTSIYDVVHEFGPFKNPDTLKKSKHWKNLLEKAQENPENFIVTNEMIASKDYDEPFIYGDVMEGLFRAEIIPV